MEPIQSTYELAEMSSGIYPNVFHGQVWLAVLTVPARTYNPQYLSSSLESRVCGGRELQEKDVPEYIPLCPDVITPLCPQTADGVPCSQNPTVAIETWINFNKEERAGFSETLRSSLKVQRDLLLRGCFHTSQGRVLCSPV